MSIDRLLAALEGVKQNGPDRYMAKCPVHTEKRSSLLITPKPDGKITAYCFGCGAKGPEVAWALGLPLAALFPPRPTYRYTPRSLPPTRSQKPARHTLDRNGWLLLFKTAVDWDIDPIAFNQIKRQVEDDELFRRYGPALRVQANLKDRAPEWAIAARDCKG